MTHTLNKKVFASLFVFGSLMAASVVVAPHSSAATKPAISTNVIGKAKFVFQGTVTAAATNSLIVHVTNTSKNARQFDGKDVAVSVTSKTTLTKNAKSILFNRIKSGDKIKVFGIFNKKTGAIVLVRWIKVITQ